MPSPCHNLLGQKYPRDFKGRRAEFGRRLRNWRYRREFNTLWALAREVRVTESAVSRWETGRRLPRWDLLMALCDALDIPPRELFP